MRLRSSAGVFIFSLWCSVAQATPPLMEKLQAMESLHTAFSQQINGELHTGSLWVSKPSRFRIETTSPWQQILISDGTTFWNYDIDLEQLTIANLEHDPQKYPILLFSGTDANLNDSYHVSSYADEELDVYVLIPKENNQFFASITLTFSGETPSAIIIRDAAGQRTEIIFDSAQTNIELSEDLFEFSAPADTDIVDQRTFAGDS
jgi:outer membrane lipoprotein carrier protein